MKLSLIAVFFAACIAPAAAQSIYIKSSVKPGDFVGNAFVFALKEDFRKSSTYSVLDASDGKSVQISVISLKDGEGSAALSIVTTMPWTDDGQWIIDHQVLLVGESKVQEMAAYLVADTDDSLGKLRASFHKVLGESKPTQATK